MWFAQNLGLDKDLTSQQTDLLKRLEETIVWRGRYPVPKPHNKQGSGHIPTISGRTSYEVMARRRNAGMDGPIKPY